MFSVCFWAPREVALNALHGRALRYIFALSAKDAAATSQEARAALLLGRWRGGIFHILKLHEYLYFAIQKSHEFNQNISPNLFHPEPSRFVFHVFI